LVAMSGISSITQGVSDQVANASERVLDAIKQASAKVGVDFSYLLNKAEQESGLDPNAKSASSSATGLFQFIDQTWLRMVKTYGAKFGLASAADSISIGSDGVARVTDAQTKQNILALRKDPSLSADMAAELTNENKEKLQCEVGGKVGSTELYLAHFLGAGGATAFLNTMKANPNAKAADVLPEAADANSSVFFDKAGNPRSLSEVYNHFAQKFEKNCGTTATASAATSSAKTSSASSTKLSAATYSLASALSSGMTSGSTAASASGLGGFSSFHPDSALSSPLAAMIFAQSNEDEATAYKSLNAYSSDDQDKKRSNSLFAFSA